MMARRRLFGVLVVLAVAAGACRAEPAQAADGNPPTLRIRLVNDLDAVALAQVRARVQSDAQLCRGLLHMPDAAPPELPDGVLRKIVFHEEEQLFRPDRLGHFTTHRSVQVDEASRCEPFVWVFREASVTFGCEGQSVGVGHMALEAWLPGIPRPAPAPPSVKFLSDAARSCPGTKKVLTADGVPRMDAGFGQQCVWASQLMWTHLGQMQAAMAQANPGTGGNGPDMRPRRADVCLLAERTSYRSPQLTGRPVVLMSHWTRPTEGTPDEAAVQYLTGNLHLAQFVEGGAIADAELSKERVKAFIDMPWREALPVAP